MVTFNQTTYLTFCQSLDLPQSEDNSTACSPWFFYNVTLGQCQCFETLNFDVECTEREALLRFGRCMTYQDEEHTTSVGFCPYFLVDNFVENVTQSVFIRLPSNVSELNDYMCGNLNRKGFQCSECIEGYGLSWTFLGYQCSNCDGVWYGVPVYLLLQFAPLTVFYFIILLFRLNVTTAPLTSYILFSQLTYYSFTLNGETRSVFRAHLANKETFTLVSTMIEFYGIWNLDFFRNVIPPFCVSQNLKLIHFYFLEYISAFYPLVLIAVTWIWIELASRGFKPIVCLLKNKCCSGKRLHWDKKHTVIDVFATFLLLSYTKILLHSLLVSAPIVIQVLNATGSLSSVRTSLDISIGFLSRKHLPFAICSVIIFLTLGISPALLLALYPLKCFRKLLHKFRLLGHHNAAFHLFVEKFYACYKDGLRGGRDLRSFASLFFFFRLILVFIDETTFDFIGRTGADVNDTQIVTLVSRVIVIAVLTLIIAIVRPYKEAYMNVLDTLVLSTMTFGSFLPIVSLSGMSDVNSSLGRFLLNLSIVVLSVPQLGFYVYLFVRFYQRKAPVKWIKLKCTSIKHRIQECCFARSLSTEEMMMEMVDDGLPDRFVHPELYYTNNLNNLTPMTDSTTV